jgi:TDG/mug DNA glycosylase family protein
LKIVFVGINPGLISAKAGHYYANPRNPFWRLLHEAGLTPVRLAPEEDARLLEFGYGITDIVKRPSRGAGDLALREFLDGRKILEQKLLSSQPLIVCFNSKTAFVGFFGKDAFRAFGRQRVRIGQARVYVLPSTSPANAAVPISAKRHYFLGLKKWVQQITAGD